MPIFERDDKQARQVSARDEYTDTSGNEAPAVEPSDSTQPQSEGEGGQGYAPETGGRDPLNKYGPAGTDQPEQKDYNFKPGIIQASYETTAPQQSSVDKTINYQEQVSKLRNAGFSGSDIQNWSDNQAVKLRQGGFSQDEIDAYQGMKPPVPGTPPVYGRVPTDDDFKNAATVMLNGSDHPNYDGAVDTLKNIHAQTGVGPGEAVKLGNTIPSFKNIMETSDRSTLGQYWQDFARSIDMTIASGARGLAELSNPDPNTQTLMSKPLITFGGEAQKPEDYWLYQKGTAFQQMVEKNLPAQPVFDALHPTGSSVAKGLGMLPVLLAPGGIGIAVMVGSSADASYQDAKQAGKSAEDATRVAGQTGALWGALSVVDAGAFLKPIQRAAPGFSSWIVAKGLQAIRGGTVMASTNEFGDYLNSEIEKAAEIPAQYKPALQRIVTNALIGSVGGLAGRTPVREGAPSGAEAVPPEHAGITEPWQMTKEEFEKNAIYQGVHPSSDEAKPSGWFTNNVKEAKRFATVLRDLPNKTVAKIVLAFKNSLPENAHVETNPGTVWENGESVGSTHYYTGFEGAERPSATHDLPLEAAEDPHRYFVEKALAEGKNVPDKVLADYPDLVGKKKPPPSAPATTLTPAYHFDTDSWGNKDQNGNWVQTGFPTEQDARTNAEQAPAPTYPPTSRLEPEVIDRYKKTISDQADKIGIPLTPEQLQVAATKMAESHNPIVEPQKPEVTPAEPAYVTIPKKPLGLADFVRQAGGVNDEGGDVRSILGGARFRPGLINGEGKSLDDMALAAHEAGYFNERPDVNQFLDKLSDDLHGKSQHSAHDQEAVNAYQDALRYNAETDRVSTETGIPAEGKTHTQFWDEVAKYYSRDQAAEKRTDFTQRAQDAYESWRTEALEPEEKLTKEELEHERTQDNITKDQKPIPQSPLESRPASDYTREGEAIGGLGGRSTEPTGGARPAEAAEGEPAATAVRPESSEGGGNTSAGATLPRDLRGAKPRYGFGQKQFTLQFDSDVDKALYITSQKSPSKRDADYRGFLEDQGFTPQQIDAQGREIRASIKRMVQDHPDFGDTSKVSNLKIPDQLHQDELLYQKGQLNRGILSAVRDPQHIQLLESVDKYLQRVLPKEYSYETTPGFIKTDTGENAYGLTDRTRNLITLSLQSPDQFATGAHEAMHAVRYLLTPDEWKTLTAEAEKKGLREKYDIDNRYKEDQEEETIAHWYEDWQKDQASASKTSSGLFDKIAKVFKNIASKVRAIFGNQSAEDIFSKIESGEIGQREGELGEGALYEKAGKPEEKEKPTLGDAIKGIRDTFSPTSAGDLAKRTETEIRAAYGDAKRERAVAETALGEFARQANKMTPDEHMDFYNYVEGRSKGAELKNKQFQAMANTVRKVYQDYKNLIQAMPETRMQHFVTDYFTHQWADGQDAKIQDFMNAWWQQGSGRNLKERKIPTIADGLAYGLKLAESNPVRAVSRYAGSMSNYLASVKVLRAINNDLGGAYYADGLQPQGYKPLVGRNAERIENARIDPASGKIIPARNLHLYAPTQVADLYNAFYSKGFEDSRLKPAYMLARNAINTNTLMELGLSAYHFSTITMQSLNQDMGRILRNATVGDWQGVGDAIKGLVTPTLHFGEGQKLMDQYKDLEDHGVDMERLADEFSKSNLRVGIDPLSNVSTHGGFYKAWQRGELPQVMDRLKSQMNEGYGIGALKSGAEAVSRIVQDVAHPLFNIYIPAIKMSAFHDLMGDWLRQNPGASDGEIANARVRIGDMVEDRFGEMNMENIFWNKKAKELLGLGLRAPGWDIGLVRQIGGAGYDVYRLIKDGISRNGFDVNRLDRPLFVAGAAITYVALNAALTYIKTGVPPSDQKYLDWIAYSTGGLHRAFGMVAERAELPGHSREILQMAPVPGEGPLSGVTQEAGNKVATLPKKTYEAATNTDWNGKPIYDPKSKNWYQRIPGVAQAVHIASGFEPFSMEQLFEGAPEGSNLSLAERFMGARAAGAKIVNPEGLKEFNERKSH